MARQAWPVVMSTRPERRSQVGKPLPMGTAWLSVARCMIASARMLWRREVRLPRGNVGKMIRFADGSEARVYRETSSGRSPRAPCFLAVSFRLVGVRGRGHAAFRWESLLNTPLFVGFPGFVSKLWLAHDGDGTYRGLYEWDGADAAERYARSLWRVLALVSVRGSIDYRIVPGARRDEVVADPDVLAGQASPEDRAWWRPVSAR